jgi:hypothetical protein
MKNTEKPLQKADLASVAELSAFFRVDRSAVPSLMGRMGVPKRGSSYPWPRIWIVLGIDLGSVQDLGALKQPLMELKDVAAMLGESAKTTRRRSNGEHRDKTISAHIDLGPRKRLFFPAEIQSWILGEPVPFDRRQESLSFVPDKVKKGKYSPKTNNVPQTAPLGVS